MTLGRSACPAQVQEGVTKSSCVSEMQPTVVATPECKKASIWTEAFCVYKQAFEAKAWLKSGGDEEDRTPDLRIANATLSQLSYTPTCRFSIAVRNHAASAPA